jgi:hypothetical protein
VKPGGIVAIRAPHPASDAFDGDPTHIRPITPLGLSAFSKKLNAETREGGWFNNTLAEQLGIDFELRALAFRPTDRCQGLSLECNDSRRFCRLGTRGW